VISEGYSNCLTADELLDLAERTIFSIGEREASGGNIEAGELMVDGLLSIERRGRGDRPGLMTGFPDLDELLDGFKPADLIVLAARPSQGKTALALSMVGRTCLEREASVLMASLEMNRTSIADRLLSAWSAVDAMKLQRPWTMSAEEKGYLNEAADALSNARLTIDDRPNRTVAHIAANARRIKARRGLDLVAIDYLSLMDGQRQKGENRQEEVARMSGRLKGMARELNVPVLCVHQLNRQNESREDRRPRLSDLRESGQIEQDADVVLLLHRPDYYDPNDQPGIAEVIVAKNRNGPTGTVRLMFRRDCTRFENLPAY
jgi:replicative DNA helicase